MLVGVATAVATGKFKDMLHEHSLPLCRTYARWAARSVKQLCKD